VRDPGVRVVSFKTQSSCLTLSELNAVAREADVPAAPTSDGTTRAASLLERMHAKYKTRPGQEVEWLGRLRKRGTRGGLALADRLEATAFRPEHPETWLKSPREWLSDRDIEEVLRQYERHLGDRKHFRFVGVFPSDFGAPTASSSSSSSTAASSLRTCVSQKMCDTTVRQMIDDGVHVIGIVFNSDPHDAGGRHWSSCYIGIDPSSNRYGAHYYDSVAHGPMPGMMRFMRRIKLEADEAGLSSKKEFVIRSNTVRKQFKNTECGVYSIIFILMCLQTDLSFDDICAHAMHDDDATNRVRGTLYRAPL